jgi:hypothetical protein
MSNQVERINTEVFTIPNDRDFACPQMDLFQTFICNTNEQREKLSNAVPMWDCLPRYSISRTYAQKMHKAGTFPSLLNINCRYFGQDLSIEIQPARIRNELDVVVEYYPGATEEIIEEVLRKLSTIQNHGFFDKNTNGNRSGVSFTIYQVREELKRLGYTRSHREIVLSLKILSRTLIEIKADNKKNKAYNASAYFKHLSCVSRSDIEEDPRARWHIEFHPLITHAIDALEYRQFNYELMMSHSSQLARWIHKYLIIKFTFAQIGKEFKVNFSTIKRDSALLESYGRRRKSIEAVKCSLEELVAKEILMGFSEAKTFDTTGKIVDVVYTLSPSIKFSVETKAANKQVKMIEIKSKEPPTKRQNAMKV